MPISRRLCYVFIVAFFLFWIFAIKPPVLETGDGRVQQRRREQLSQQARRWISASNASSSRQSQRQTAKEEVTSFTPEVEATQSTANCPADRRPYHVLLTASTGPYQLWQTRIFYYHYVRLRATLGPCTEMGGFTRLLTKPKSAPLDSLMSVMRTVVVDELTEAETHGFVVLNRPHSVLVALNRGDLDFPEKYLFIAETDHLLMKYLPNLATEELAVAYPFHYMNPKRDSKTKSLVRRFAGSDLVAEKVQQVGPSPILIHIDALKRLVKPWYDLSFALKVDPAADAEFGWMLEMWGYSIGAAVGGVAHKLMDTLQLEPSSQFGVRTTDAAGEYTHHILHYTFSHEYSLEGGPMVDSRSGQHGFDKRHYQAWLPRELQRPPRCALESTHTLWTLLHDAMAAHDGGVNCSGCTGRGHGWEHGVPSNVIATLMMHSNQDKEVRARIDAGDGTTDPELLRAMRLVGSGPWAFSAVAGSSAAAATAGSVDRGFFFLRGGQLHTPWGSAAWGLSRSGAGSRVFVDGGSNVQTSDPIVIYLCGRLKWTHSVRFQRTDGRPLDGSTVLNGFDWLKEVQLVMTARESGEQQVGTYDALSHDALATIGAATISPNDEILAAFLGHEDPRPGDADAAAVRRRLMGTGGWPLGRLGNVFLLAHGVAYYEGAHKLGSWHAEVTGGKPSIVLRGGGVSGAKLTLASLLSSGDGTDDQLQLDVNCWRLSNRAAGIGGELVWRHPASRCFPTCSDSTHQLNGAEYGSSALAKRVAKYKWTWANVPGLEFAFPAAERVGVLVTPWGHGEWGITPSRTDVLLAEFAQQRHMLQFDDKEAKFTSTRCSDGEVVRGQAIGWTKGMAW